MTFLSVEQPDDRVSSASGIAVDFLRDWPQAASRLNAGHRTAFQHAHWLGAWYAAFADHAPLIAVISDAPLSRADVRAFARGDDLVAPAGVQIDTRVFVVAPQEQP